MQLPERKFSNINQVVCILHLFAVTTPQWLFYVVVSGTRIIQRNYR